MANINDRILSVRQAVSKSNLDFAKQLGEDRSTVIDNVTKGETEPKYWLLEKIITTFIVNAEWLITGKGEMFASDKKNLTENNMDKDREIQLLEKNIKNLEDAVAAHLRTIADLRRDVAIEALRGELRAKDEIIADLKNRLGDKPKSYPTHLTFKGEKD